MSAGRIESYTHNDSITQNKGGAMVKVACETDFAAKTDEFIAFCVEAAKMAYAAGEESWAAVIEAFPFIEDKRVALEATLKEEIAVTRIAVFIL
jgi:translation elongation factor EF-Ts